MNRPPPSNRKPYARIATRNYHEHSETINYRKSGFLLAGIVASLYVLLLFQGVNRPLLAWISAGLCVCAIIDAAPLRMAIRCCIKVGNHIHRFTNPLIVGLIYLLTIIPVSLVMKFLGKDLLALRCDKTATTYWQTSQVSSRSLFRKQYS